MSTSRALKRSGLASKLEETPLSGVKVMKSISSLLLRSALLVVALGLGTGCAKPPNDAQVTSEIQTRLAADSGLQNKPLTVQAANAPVTLSGTVDNDAEREAAARYAASAPGVKQG